MFTVALFLTENNKAIKIPLVKESLKKINTRVYREGVLRSCRSTWTVTHSEKKKGRL